MDIIWIKSKRSSNNGACVEIDATSTPGTVRMRDSKLGDASPILNFTDKEWEAFRLGVVDGEFTF